MKGMDQNSVMPQVDHQVDHQVHDLFDFGPVHDTTAYPDVPVDDIFSGIFTSLAHNEDDFSFAGTVSPLNTSFTVRMGGVYHSPRSVRTSVSHSPLVPQEQDGIIDPEIYPKTVGPVDPVLLRQLDTSKHTVEPSLLTPASLGARSSDASCTSIHTWQNKSRSDSLSSTRSKHKRVRRASKASKSSAADTPNREQLLERNRVAASKCRAKRKVEEKELARRTESLEAENFRLKAEFNSLVAERNTKKSEVLDAAYCHRNHPDIQQWVNTRAMAIAHGVEIPVSQSLQASSFVSSMASPNIASCPKSRSATPHDRREGSTPSYVKPSGTALASATSPVFGHSLGGASFTYSHTSRQSSGGSGSACCSAIPDYHIETNFADEFDSKFAVANGTSNMVSVGPSPTMCIDSDSVAGRGVNNMKQNT